MNLLHLEFKKWWRYRGLIWSLILYVILIILFSYISYKSFNANLIFYISSWLFYLPAITLISLTHEEFRHRTHRQLIISGQTRKQFVTGKVQLLLLFSTVHSLCTWLIACIPYWQNKASATLPSTFQLIAFWMAATVYLSAGLFLAFTMRSSIGAILTLIVYGLFLENPLMIKGITQGLDYLLSPTAPLPVIAQYLPLQCADYLSLSISGHLSRFLLPPNLQSTHLLIICAIWSLLLIKLSYWNYQRRDL